MTSKFVVKFNDGEYIGEYDTFEEANKQKQYIFHHFISRYAIIYHNGKEVNKSNI